MTTRQKLEIIQKSLELNQVALAQRFDVSFVSFNRWWTGKSVPRAKKLQAIEELYLEVTGQRQISPRELEFKKQEIAELAAKRPAVLRHILTHTDIRDELILKLTYHSNSIEGSTLTEADTADVLFDNVALANRTLIEQIEAKNHQAALHYLLDYMATRDPITERCLQRLHEILLNGIQSDAGQYRRHRQCTVPRIPRHGDDRANGRQHRRADRT